MTATDPAGNPGHVIADELIESAWGNAVADRVVLKFATGTALLASTPPDGTLAADLALGVVWLRDRGSWKATAAGNVVSFRVLGGGAGQVLPVTTETLCTWNSEASDPYDVISGGTFTVPNGWAGRWVFDWCVGFSGAGATPAVRRVFCGVAGGRYGQTNITLTDGSDLTGSTAAIMSAGQTAGILAYHSFPSSAMVINASTTQYFQGRFAGPA